MSVKISEQEFNMMLVEAIRKHPCLYNYNIPNYTRKDVVDQAWTDVGNEVNETVHTCKLRWKNIRTVFVRKIKAEKPGLTMKSNKPYYLCNKLQFLIPFLKASASRDSADSADKIKIEDTELTEQDDNYYTDNHNNEDTSDEDFSETESVQIKTIDINEKDIEETNPLAVNLPKEDASNLKILTNVTKRKRKMQLTDDDDDNDEFFEFCNKSSHKVDDLDPNKMFLLSILPDIHQMNENQTRKFKRKVLEIIDDILDEKTT